MQSFGHRVKLHLLGDRIERLLQKAQSLLPFKES